MNSKTVLLFLTLAAAASWAPAQADDLHGASKILCAAAQATVCTVDGECVSGAPWNWNIPQFVVVDLGEKRLGTTKASGENRTTPIKNVERADGLIVLQGVEAGRAFSFVIDETSGMLSAAVARADLTVSAFGSCTPMEVGQ
jgi:hypothetical protein